MSDVKSVLRQLARLETQIRYTGRFDAGWSEDVDDAIALIESQAAEIERLQGEVERLQSVEGVVKAMMRQVGTDNLVIGVTDD